MLRLCLQSNFEMLYLSIIFLLHVVAVVMSSNSCLIQTCSASQGGDIAAAIYDTSDPDGGGPDDADAVTNFLTSNCGLSPQITQCYVDRNGIYGGTGAYWTDQNCGSQCGIVAPLVNCFGYNAWFCSTAVSNVCQLAAPPTPTNNRKWSSGGPAICFLLITPLKATPTGQATGTGSQMESQAQEEFKCYGLPYGVLGFVSHILTLYTVLRQLNLRKSYWPGYRIEPMGTFRNAAFSSALFGGTTTLAIITMVRCKNHWRYILLAVEHLCLSMTISFLGFSISSGDVNSHRLNSYIIYCCVTTPGVLVGGVGYLALLAQNWSDRDVRIAFGSTAAGSSVMITVAMYFAFRHAPDGTHPLSFLISVNLMVVAFDDWILGIIAKNIVGIPVGRVALLVWLYFAIRRLAMLIS